MDTQTGSLVGAVRMTTSITGNRAGFLSLKHFLTSDVRDLGTNFISVLTKSTKSTKLFTRGIVS